MSRARPARVLTERCERGTYFTYLYGPTDHAASIAGGRGHEADRLAPSLASCLGTPENKYVAAVWNWDTDERTDVAIR